MDTISLYKHRIDALMDILFGAGVSNPQTIIEQLNYLLFLRALSIKDDEAESTYMIGEAQIQSGLDRMAEDYTHHWIDFLNENDCDRTTIKQPTWR